ncbi:hypothetical protein ACFVZM_33860 [Streptomyces sioyaensis]|uniref:hypothetical protein n=1 Tax=Streptomyces sioyaensis TaxID=67364 RepID=UPI0036BD3309
MATETHAFVDWTSRDSDQRATGVMDGRTVTVSGPLRETDLNGEYTGFGTSSFDPSLPTSDAIELTSKPANPEFTVDFGAEVHDAVFYLGSLGSILTLPVDAVATKLSGDQDFTIEHDNVVVGVAKNATATTPSDSNGSVRISRPAPFRSITFNLKPNAAIEKDGVMLQIGRIEKFVDWTSRDGDQKATGAMDGRTVTVRGPLGETDLNEEYTGFGTSSFDPSLPTSDAIELTSKPANPEFTVDFGAEVHDAVFYLGSLGSILTFPVGTVATKLSGDQDFTIEHDNVVVGVAKNATATTPSDSNGSVRISRPAPFRSITFNLKPNAAIEKDGVMLQIGG